MKIKAFEIRDAATFIPAVAIQMVTDYVFRYDETNPERYLLRRAGFSDTDHPCILLCRMEASDVDRNATYDPYSWGGGSRTMQVAHLYITEHFDALESGDVIDVEFILGESKTIKLSERLETV